MQDKLLKNHEKAFLEFARAVISHVFDKNSRPEEEIVNIPSSLLDQKRGVFVTLHKRGKLRGCIGNLEPIKTLKEAIEENARHAAFKDTRFSPLTPGELDDTTIEISILTSPEKLEYHKIEELKSALTPLQDGVIIQHEFKRATFLPQVWEQLPAHDDFLGHLCMKAGLDSKAWKKEKIEVFTYQVESFEENSQTK